MSISWLETFLGRVSKPTYYRSHLAREIQEDFAKAALEETVALVNKKIEYLERRRKDIVFIEIIESTVQRRPIACPPYTKFKFSSAACSFTSLNSNNTINSTPSTPHTRTALVRQSDPYPLDGGRSKSTYIKPGEVDFDRVKTAGMRLDSKTMMLENEGKIQWYKKVRDGVRTAMRIRTRINSAVYRCPLDIWSRIFMFCLPAPDHNATTNDNSNKNNNNEEEEDAFDDESNVYYLDPSQEAAPLLLCRVCYTWRSAAIQTPALWSSLIVRLRTQSNRMSFLQTWVGRAGALPLSLHIIWGPTQSLHFHDRTFDYLLTLAARWKRLRLSVVKGVSVWQAHGFPTRAHKLISYAMPQLEVLVLEPYSSLNIMSLQRNAPALRELRLTNGALNPMHLIVPSGTGTGGLSMNGGVGGWTQLVKFSSPYPLDIGNALRILKACPNLVECILRVGSCPTSAECVEGGAARMALRNSHGYRKTGAGFLRMERLRRFVVGGTAPRVVDTLFRMLVLPNIVELEVGAARWAASGAGERWRDKELLLLVHRSSDLEEEEREKAMKFGLRKLRISGLNFSEEVLRNLVCGIPSLEILDVKNGEMELSGKSWVDMMRIQKTKNKL